MIQLAALQKVPGLGKNKAAMLLERFGSISALKTASVEEIEAVPGIGRELAERVMKSLQ